MDNDLLATGEHQGWQRVSPALAGAQMVLRAGLGGRPDSCRNAAGRSLLAAGSKFPPLGFKVMQRAHRVLCTRSQVRPPTARDNFHRLSTATAARELSNGSPFPACPAEAD